MPKQKKPPSESAAKPSGRTVIPVVEETVRTGTRRVVTGRVRINKRVEERTEKVDVPVTRAEIEVRRVPVNRPVAAAPAVKRAGDTLIIPVVEEELVITKRLVLKEEIHVTTRRIQEKQKETVVLRRERATVDRGAA